MARMNTDRMLALIEDGEGGLTPTEVPQPPLREGEVLLEVVAAGVNRADLSQLAGNYPAPPGESDILGLEAAGRVVELGPGVEEGLGREVCALLPGGGYAQRVAVPADLLMDIPPGWSFEEAAAFPETAFTAFLNLFMEAGLEPGGTVLIHGGASGVGTAAIVLAKLAGATVITTSGGEAKVEVCRRLGADVALDRHAGPWLQSVKSEVGRVDVILDMVGSDYFEQNMAALATGGRLVIISTLSGRKAEIDLGRLMVKRARVIGSTLRSRPGAEKVRIRNEFLERFGHEMRSGALKPLIDNVYPWERVNDAHAYMRENRNMGKLVLVVGNADA